MIAINPIKEVFNRINNLDPTKNNDMCNQLVNNDLPLLDDIIDKKGLTDPRKNCLRILLL